MTSEAEPSGAAPPRLDIFRVAEHAFEIVPGRAARDWMDRTPDGYAKRCLPMVVANASGWEILSPCSFEAIWDGASFIEGMTFKALDDYPHFAEAVQSQFGNGVVTFRFGLLFRTDPGWAVWLRGAPNFGLDGIHPLDGLVETDWLPFGATMNWRFTRPGRVAFAKGDPIGFVVPMPHLLLDGIAPRFRSLSDEPELAARHAAWEADRAAVKAAFQQPREAGEKLPWPMHYVRGLLHDGSRAPDTHLTKRRLKSPQ